MPAAFAQAALTIGAEAFDPEAIEEREVREVRAHGPTPEALFVHWINECLYVHEVEGFAWRRIDFAVFDTEPRAGAEPMRLHSLLHGESLEAGGPPIRGTMPSISAGTVSLRTLGDEFELSIAV
jgi:SHS2 domain-containing protein